VATPTLSSSCSVSIPALATEITRAPGVRLSAGMSPSVSAKVPRVQGRTLMMCPFVHMSGQVREKDAASVYGYTGKL
jgi:hypothetical protein